MIALLLSLALLPVPTQDQAGSRTRPAFDHSYQSWNLLLRHFVHAGGLVDYQGLARVRPELDTFLAALRSVARADFRRWNRQQREAYWINAYNAFTVQLILDHYPVKSIRDISGFLSSVFSKEFIPLQHLSDDHDEPLSLNEVEHEILGEHFRPLFHFAINCASIGCPELRAGAYTADNLNAQLAEQARKFLADPSRNGQEIVDGDLKVSFIFDWSEDELEKHRGGIAGIFRDFGPPAVAKDPELAGVDFEYLDYDWSLNEWKARIPQESTPPR